jgi:hypothetical protein
MTVIFRAGITRAYRGSPPNRPVVAYPADMTAFLRRLIRATRIVATDTRIPRPLRWFAALGLLPIPGPFDEAILVLVAIPLALFYRGPLHEAWRAARTP